MDADLLKAIVTEAVREAVADKLAPIMEALAQQADDTRAILEALVEALEQAKADRALICSDTATIMSRQDDHGAILQAVMVDGRKCLEMSQGLAGSVTKFYQGIAETLNQPPPTTKPAATASATAGTGSSLFED